MSFFYLWIPQFPSWAMAQGDPDLAKRRFAICENGKIISASPLAEKHGVRLGMPACSARLWCNGLRILPRDIAREAAVWEEVQRAVHDIAPRVEAIEPGLLVTETDASRMSRLVHLWGAHGGQGTDRATAHLAALVAERREIRCVRRGREDSFASRVPLDFLLDAGLAEKSLDRLHKYGYRSVADAWELSESQINELLGKDAQLLFELSRGPYHEANVRRVDWWAPPQEITAQQSLAMPAVEARQWEETLDQLLARACGQPGARSAQRVQIVAQTATMSVTARRFLKQPARRSKQLRQLARTALYDALQSVQPLAPVVTGLEVRLGAFQTDSVAPANCALAASSRRSLFFSRGWLCAYHRLQSSVSSLGHHLLTGDRVSHQSKSARRKVTSVGSHATTNPMGANTVQARFNPTTAAPRPLTLNKSRR